MIPQYISRKALYTGQFILGTGIYCVYDNYMSLSLLLFFLYATTMLNWNKVKRDGLVRKLDICAVFSVLGKTSFIDSIRWNKYRQVWFCVLGASFIAYSANKRYFEYKKSFRKLVDKDYYLSVFVHVTFLHIIIPSTGCYCAIMSKRQI